jgi:hypothetical protein
MLLVVEYLAGTKLLFKEVHMKVHLLFWSGIILAGFSAYSANSESSNIHKFCAMAGVSIGCLLLFGAFRYMAKETKQIKGD